MKNLKKQLEERLNALEDAYNETGRPKIDFSVFPEDMRENSEAEYNAKVIVEAARKIEREHGSGEIDWADRNQLKWIPWFWMLPSGFAFSGSVCGGWVCGCGFRVAPSRFNGRSVNAHRKKFS